MLEPALDRLRHSLVRSPRRWGLALLALAGLLAWPAGRLDPRLGEDDFLPLTRSGSPRAADSSRLTADVSRLTAGRRRVAVLLASDSAIPLADVAAVFSYLEPRLAGLPLVRTVRARLSPAERRLLEDRVGSNALLYADTADLRTVLARLTPEGIREALAAATDSGGAEERLAQIRRQRDPLGLFGVVSREAHRWQGTARARVVDGYVALPDRRGFVLVIETESALDRIAEAREWIRGLQDVLAGARADTAVGRLLAGRRLDAIGGRVALVSAFDALYRDVVRVSLAAAITVAVLLALFFRNLAAPLILLLPVAAALLATAAVASLVLGSVSLVAWVFIAMIIGLGVDFGIHVTCHYWMLARPGAGRDEALAAALLKPGPAILVSGLTSAAALGFVAAIPYPVTREIGGLAALGLLAALAASFTLLPLLLLRSRPSPRSPAPWPTLTTPFSRVHLARPVLAAAPWILLIGAALLAAPTLGFDAHPWSFLASDNADMMRLARLDEELGASLTPLLVIATGRTRDEALQRDRRAVGKLHAIALRAGVGYVESLSRWIPDPAVERENRRLLAAARASPGRVMRDFQAALDPRAGASGYLTREYLPAISTLLDPAGGPLDLDWLEGTGAGDLVTRHLVRHQDGHAAVSFVYLRRSPWSPGAVAQFVDRISAAGVLGPGVTLAGRALRAPADTAPVRRGAVLPILLAAAAVGTFLWLRFRRWGRVLLCLAPALAGLALAVLLVKALDLELTLLTLVIGPVLVGIGVDDGIHVVERLGRGQDLQGALREAGPGMVMTTLTTVGAFACLALATLPHVRLLGLVAAAGLLTSLLASLHLVPAGWRLLYGRCPGDEGPAAS